MKIQKTTFGATVTFEETDALGECTMNFQYNAGDDERDPFWDYDGSGDTFETLESAIDDYVTYQTES